MAEIANGVYGPETVTANYVQFWFRRFRSGIFDVKDAPRTGRRVVENADKITEIIEVDWHVSSRSIAQKFATTKVIKIKLQDINVNVSERTVRRKIKDLNFKTCRPARKPVNPAMKAKRLNFAKTVV
ncbi:histone-lysine N-methyltransferase SETMAR [Trichonephila clavipes]|nr:histone-lysine N-methyltransferase SETMAR [Trichonephila clavipes]